MKKVARLDLLYGTYAIYNDEDLLQESKVQSTINMIVQRAHTFRTTPQFRSTMIPLE